MPWCVSGGDIFERLKWEAPYASTGYIVSQKVVDIRKILGLSNRVVMVSVGEVFPYFRIGPTYLKQLDHMGWTR